jgi:tetratricopeptide (TPR) repeat protein
MTQIRIRIPPPANPDDFEKIALKLLQRRWENHNLQLYGRRGQRQHGVDIFDPTASTPHRAAQCKMYEPLEPLTAKLIREAVKEALAFTPKLDVFAILATAKQATECQQAVKEINLEHQAAGLFVVEYLPWAAIEDLLNEFPDIRGQFYSPVEPGTLDPILNETQRIFAAVQVIGSGPTSGEIDVELDRCKALIESHKPEEARLFLQRLQDHSWDRLTDRQKFRVKANLGATWLGIGDYKRAGALYVEAKSFQPSDPKALANEALGYLLLGEIDKAYHLANGLCQQFPTEKLAHAVWINASPLTVSVSTVVERVPSHLQNEVEVCLALANRAFLQKDWSTAMAFAKKATELAETNPSGWGLLGKITVHKDIFAGWEGMGIPTKIRSREKATEAEEYFTKALTLARRQKNPEILVELLLDRAAIRAVTENRMGARQDVEEAKSLRPESVAVQKEYAEILRIEQFFTPAIDMLRSIKKEDAGPDVEAMLGLTLRQRNQPGDTEEALTRFGDIARYPKQLPPGFREAAIHWAIDGYVGQRSNKAEELIESVPEEHLSKSLRHYFRARVKLLQGDKEGALEEALVALNELTAKSRLDEMRHVASLLADVGKWQEAHTLWKRVAEVSKWESDTKQLLQCAARLGLDQEALEICQRLRASGEADDSILEFELSLIEKYDTDAAIGILRLRIEKNPADKIAQLHLSSIGLHIDRPELVNALPNGLPTVDEVTPAIGLAVVRVLKMGHSPTAAVVYAYELLRHHFDDADSHRAFLLAMAPYGPEPEISRPEIVEVGAAVRYRELGDVLDQFVIIEDSANPDAKMREFSPDHPISRELLGKRAGDTFTIAPGHVSKRQGTIQEIQSKFVYRYQDSMAQWQVRFPDSPEVESIRLLQKPGSEGEYDLTPFLQSLDRRREFRQEMVQHYGRQPMPIHLFGHFFNQNSFDALLHLATSEDTEVKCCNGSVPEVSGALLTLTSQNAIVIDLTTIGTLFLLDQTKVLSSIPGRFVVSSGTVNELKQMVVEMLLPGGETGYAGKNDDGYYMVSESASGRREKAEALRELIKTLEANCRVTSGIDLAAIDPEKRKLMSRLFGQDGAESIALAAKPGHVLWSDDAVVGAYATSELGVKRVWTQIVLQWMANTGSMAEKDFYDCAANLFGWGYQFTSMSSNSLVSAGALAEWNPNGWPFSRCLELFRSENVDLSALINIAGRFLAELYKACSIPDLRQRVVTTLLDGLSSRGGGFSAVQALRALVPRLFGLNVVGAAEALSVFDAWLRIHTSKIPVLR